MSNKILFRCQMSWATGQLTMCRAKITQLRKMHISEGICPKSGLSLGDDIKQHQAAPSTQMHQLLMYHMYHIARISSLSKVDAGTRNW